MIVNVFNGALILTILQFVKQEEMINFIGWGMGQIPEYLSHGVRPAAQFFPDQANDGHVRGGPHRGNLLQLFFGHFSTLLEGTLFLSYLFFP